MDTPIKKQGDEMDLPAGKTCNDCMHCARCCKMFGAHPENEVCDFYPVRFREPPPHTNAGAE